MYRRYYNRRNQYVGHSYGCLTWLIFGLTKFLVIGAVLTAILGWPVLVWHSWPGWLAEVGWVAVLALGGTGMALGQDHRHGQVQRRAGNPRDWTPPG